MRYRLLTLGSGLENDVLGESDNDTRYVVSVMLATTVKPQNILINMTYFKLVILLYYYLRDN